MPTDLRTHAIILRRTNFGESDRILSFLTPEGKVSALAHGVRKEKSRLAGGIELFCVSDIVVHFGHGRLATLTSAKMLNFYSNILSDLSRLELASGFLKKLDRAAEQVNIPEHFSLLSQSLSALNQGISLDLIQTWFIFNLCRVSGEEPNFLVDTSGAPLLPDQIYSWNYLEGALSPDFNGLFSAREIKLARFLLSHPLSHAAKIDNLSASLPPLLDLVKKLGS